jgi:hypothetical protein
MRIFVALIALSGCATRLPFDDGAPHDLAGAPPEDMPNPAGVDLGARDLAEPSDLTARPDGPVPYGVINVINNPSPDDGGTILSSAGATFANDCRIDPVGGPCARVTCTPTTMHDSGTITVVGGTSKVALTYSTPSGYSDFSSTTRVWPPGTQLSIAAAGAEVPAWSASLTMPNTVTIAFPDLTGSPTFPRSSDLPFKWQGGSSLISISLVRTGFVISCQLPAANGFGAIPSSVLQQLPAGAWTLSADAIDRSLAPDGIWTINVVAINQAVTINQQLYQGTIQLQ